MGDPELGGYDIVEFVIDQASVTITPLAVVVTHKPGIPTLPPLPEDLGTDGIGIFGSYELGDETKSVALRLEAPYATVRLEILQTTDRSNYYYFASCGTCS